MLDRIDLAAIKRRASLGGHVTLPRQEVLALVAVVVAAARCLDEADEDTYLVGIGDLQAALSRFASRPEAPHG